MYQQYTDQEIIRAARLSTNPVVKDLLRRIERQRRQLDIINGLIDQIHETLRG
mgnify:CR=1 FL=1